MKTINVTLTDEEHETLVRVKGDLNWHDFIMKTTRYDALEVLYHAAMSQLQAGGNDEGLIEQYLEGGFYAEEYAIYQGYKNAHEYAIAQEQSEDEFLERVTKKMKERKMK